MKYRLRIGIRYPREEKEIDFCKSENKKAIEEAVEIFNGSNNNKSIEEFSISKNYIEIKFQCNKPIARPLKELSSFSRNLYPTLKEYSSVTGKLFKAISIYEINPELNEKTNSLEDTYLSDEQLINVLRCWVEIKNVGCDVNREKRNIAIQKIKDIVLEIL